MTAKLPPSNLSLDPCDVVSLSNDRRLIDYRITRIGDASGRAIEAIGTDAAIYDLAPGQYRPASLPGATDTELFAGANALAVESAPDTWEVIQFGNAELFP